MEHKPSKLNALISSTEKIKHLVKIFELAKNKVPCTTSLKIAEVFGKDHKHVRRDIEKLLETGEFNQSNFGQIFYKDSYGREQPMYLLDETFTTVLLMGFTGKKAVKWKIAYAKEFQRMRKQIEKGNRIVRTTFDEPAQYNKTMNDILLYVRSSMGKDTKSHHYMAMAENVNEIAFGERGKGKELRKNMNLQDYQNLNRTITAHISAIIKGNIHKKEIEEYIDKNGLLMKLKLSTKN